MMSDKLKEAAQAALDAMKLARGDHGTIMLAYPAIESWLYHRVDQRLDDAIKAVEDALAEPAIKESLTVVEQEPVAWTTMPEAEDWCFVSSSKDPTGKLDGKWFPLYAAPPRREWVGLTDDEIGGWFTDNTALTSESGKRIYRAIEAKLREKNT